MSTSEMVETCRGLESRGEERLPGPGVADEEGGGERRAPDREGAIDVVRTQQHFGRPPRPEVRIATAAGRAAGVGVEDEQVHPGVDPMRMVECGERVLVEMIPDRIIRTKSPVRSAGSSAAPAATSRTCTFLPRPLLRRLAVCKLGSVRCSTTTVNVRVAGCAGLRSPPRRLSHSA